MAGVIHEHKRYYYTLIIYYLLESIQNTTQIFPRLNHNVRLFRVSTGALA